MKTSRIEKCVNEAWKKAIKDYKGCHIWWQESDWVASMYSYLRNTLKNEKNIRVVTEYRPDRPKNAKWCNDCSLRSECNVKEEYTTQKERNFLDLAIVHFSEKLNNQSGIPKGEWFKMLWCVKHTPIVAIQFKCNVGLHESCTYQKRSTTKFMKDVLILNEMISRWKTKYGFMFAVTDLDSKHNFDAYFPDKSLKQIPAENREKIKLGILNFSKYPNESEIHSLNHFKKNWDKL